MSLPNSYCVKTERVTLRKISDLTYEATLPKYGQYIHNLMLVCNPIITDRDTTRCLIGLCFSTIQHISLCFNNVPAVTLYNSNVYDQVVNLQDVCAQYNMSVDFFRGWPIVTEALYKVTLTVQIRFNREPTVLPQLQYEMHLVDKSWHYALQNTPIHVPRSDLYSGTCCYDGGALWV